MQSSTRCTVRHSSETGPNGPGDAFTTPCDNPAALKPPGGVIYLKRRLTASTIRRSATEMTADRCDPHTPSSPVLLCVILNICPRHPPCNCLPLRPIPLPARGHDISMPGLPPPLLLPQSYPSSSADPLCDECEPRAHRDRCRTTIAPPLPSPLCLTRTQAWL